MSTKPLLRGHFHQAMFFIMVGACLPLVMKCDSPQELIAIFIYLICALAMFGISTLYHRINWSTERRLLWKKLDHSGIYLMIAGTFTPIALLGLNQNSGKTLIITIWVVAVLGIVQSIFFVNIPKLFSAIIYLFAGYLILPYMEELYYSIGVTNFWLIISGGIVYSLGAMAYGLKKPVLNPKVFSYHEVFHLFVNAGAIIHFLVIFSLVA